METEKLQINLAPGMPKAEVILREGTACKELEPKAPIKTNIWGVLGTVSEYLSKRLNCGQFEIRDCHIIIDRENCSTTLVINESDEYTRGTICGKLIYNPKFIEFGINTGKLWTPTELGLFIKMNKTFFADRKSNMELVSSLMNFTANINNKIDRSLSENGSKIDNYAQMVDSNLPSKFTIHIPIFKGMGVECVEVETLAQVNGRDVLFTLLSSGAVEILESMRDQLINEEKSKIRDIAPDIVFVEV